MPSTASNAQCDSVCEVGQILKYALYFNPRLNTFGENKVSLFLYFSVVYTLHATYFALPNS